MLPVFTVRHYMFETSFQIMDHTSDTNGQKKPDLMCRKGKRSGYSKGEYDIFIIIFLFNHVSASCRPVGKSEMSSFAYACTKALEACSKMLGFLMQSMYCLNN